MTFGGLWEWYFANQTAGAKEANTLATEGTHRRHFLRVLPARKPLSAVIPADIQGYVNARAAEKWHGRPISSDTIAKEVATLRMVWGRAAKLGLAPPVPDLDGLAYPKSREKVPFQTWAEIEAKLAAGRWTAAQAKEQWDSLYLDLDQIGELLGYVRDRTTNPLFHPLMVFLAHTGARKSEAMRCLVHDLDFAARTVLIRGRSGSRASSPTAKWACRTSLRRSSGITSTPGTSAGG
jgi:integrase